MSGVWCESKTESGGGDIIMLGGEVECSDSGPFFFVLEEFETNFSPGGSVEIGR
jgi:hypothetical protein